MVSPVPEQQQQYSLFSFILAELQRAKRASEAPWVNKIGNPSRENLVMTSAYEQANAVHTNSGGGGGASQGIPHRKAKECHLFWPGVSRKVSEKKKLSSVCYVNKRSEGLI